MSIYGDIEDLSENFFGEPIQCEWCNAALEDEDHAPGCPLDPKNDESAFDEMEGSEL